MTLPTRDELVVKMARAIQDGEFDKSGPLQKAYARDAAKRALTAIEAAGIPVGAILSGEVVPISRGALIQLTDVHCREDQAVGFTVSMLPHRDPWHSDKSYVGAWEEIWNAAKK